MENIQSYLANLNMESVKLFLNQIISSFSNLTWLDTYTSKVILLAVITYIFFIVVFLVVHKLIIKKSISIKANYITKYDEIWYLVSLNMYEFNQQAKAQWKENQLMYWAKSIIWLQQNDYISNKKKIFQDIAKLEAYIWKKIISEELISQINWLHKNFSNSSFFQNMFWRILTILTLWLYRLVQ